ncbi:MAG: hypothetical protein PVS3B1_23820 [Ktedonobacteraceae bacterium]
MRYPSAFLRFLRSLPSLSLTVRLSIFSLSFLICAFFIVLGLIVTSNRGLTPIFAIPVALAAWLFRPREAALAVGGLFLLLIIINTIVVKSLLWPFPLVISFLCGLVAALIVACSIIVLRHALAIEEAARKESLHAKQETKKAFQWQQRLNDLKDQFMLNINHELRTPLTALHGYLQLLHEDQKRRDPATQFPFIANVVQSSEELVHIVNTLLDALQYSRTAIQFEYEDLPLASVVKSAANLLEPKQWEFHDLKLLIPESLMIKADRQSFYQVLWNLLSNACKYSPRETIVTVGARREVDASQRESVCIWVRDSGPGIPPDEIPHLFERFMRLKRDQGGTIRGMGLGLYICKQLVEAMDGRIWVESSGVVGEGSCFYFTLPCIS